jgi:hypothetical protein
MSLLRFTHLLVSDEKCFFFFLPCFLTRHRKSWEEYEVVLASKFNLLAECLMLTKNIFTEKPIKNYDSHKVVNTHNDGHRSDEMEKNEQEKDERENWDEWSYRTPYQLFFY